MKKSIPFLALGATLCLAGAAIGVLSGQSAASVSADEGEFVPSSTLPTQYELDSEFRVPSGKISYEGKDIAYSEAYLTYPKGATYQQEIYVLSEAGNYDCTFVGKSGATTVYSHYEFSVSSPLYSIASKSSSVEYVDAIPTNIDPTKGLSVSIAEGDTFTFNQVVDLSKADLTTPVIKFYPYAMSVRANPANAGIDTSEPFAYDDPNKPKALDIDAKSTIVRMTDAYDPDNYVEVYDSFRVANTANNRQQQYAVAGFSGGTYCGLESNSTGTITIDGATYKPFYGTTGFGAYINTCSGKIFENRPDESGVMRKSCLGTTLDVGSTADISNADDYGHQIYFEAATNRIYIRHTSLHFVNDLDETAIYGNDGFKGFTTGEVYVSVRFAEYQAETASLDVESIYGVSGEGLNAKQMKDDTAPKIVLANDRDDFNIAVNEPFTPFEANVIDVNYSGDLTISAIYEKGSAYESQVAIADGILCPKKAGTYTIVYRAVDDFGNAAEKEVTLHAINTATNRTIDLIVDHIDSAPCGAEITLPTPSVRGYNGDVTLNCSAIYEDGTKTAISTSTWSFLPKRVGTYEILYEYTDGIVSYEDSYTMESTASDNVYLDAAYLPRYFIKGAEYTLDDARLVRCDSKNPETIVPTVSASFDGGASKTVDRSDFLVEGSSSVALTYSYDGKVIRAMDPVPVVDVDFQNKLVRANYLVSDDIAVTATSSSLILSADGSVSSPAADFANVLTLNDFSIDFDFSAANIPSGSTFDLVLSSYEDPTIQTEFHFYQQSGDVYVTYGDMLPVSVSKIYTISYNASRESFIDSSDKVFSFPSPFETGRINVSFGFSKLTEAANISIRALGEQRLSSNFYDDTEPSLTAKKIEGRHSKGETISLDFFYPCDIFSPYLEKNYSMSVTYAESEEAEPVAVKAVDGTTLDGEENVHASYSFVIDRLGDYEITYSYRDQAYVRGTLDPLLGSTSKILTAADETRPVIVLNGGYNETTIVEATANSSYEIAGYTVTDEGGGTPTVSIYAISPSFVITKMSGRSLSLNEKGVWTICYSAVDAAGNVGSILYRVNAK